MSARASRFALSAGSWERNGLGGRTPGDPAGRGAGAAGAGVPEGFGPVAWEGAAVLAAGGAAGRVGAAGAAGAAAAAPADPDVGAVAGRVKGLAGREGAAGRGGPPGGIDGGVAAGVGALTGSGARTGSRGGGGVGAGCVFGSGLDSARGGSCLTGSRGGWGLAGSALSVGAGAAGLGRVSDRARSISRRTGNTALHTAHRARTPASGTLAGSTR
jgi:hypothetical protein